MVKLRIHLAVSFSPAKLPAGPILSPRPGPILAMAVAAPEIEVRKSSPVRASATATSPRVSTKKPKKAITESMTSSVMGAPSNLGMKTPWGIWVLRICALMAENRIW